MKTDDADNSNQFFFFRHIDSVFKRGYSGGESGDIFIRINFLPLIAAQWNTPECRPDQSQNHPDCAANINTIRSHPLKASRVGTCVPKCATGVRATDKQTEGTFWKVSFHCKKGFQGDLGK